MHTSRIAASAVPAAVLGNGSLLATVSGQGRVEGLWWPHPDREQQLGELRLGIEIDGVSRWLDEEPFGWTQSYTDRSMILHTAARMRGLEVEIDDLVHPTEPALIRRVSCSKSGARVVVRYRAAEGLALAASPDVVVCAAGPSHTEAERRAAEILGTSFEQHVEARRRHDGTRIAEAERPVEPALS